MSQSVGAPAAERPRVELRGVALYALWPPEVPPPAVPSVAPEIWAGAEPVGLWRSTHLAWQPERPNVPAPWLTPEQAEAALVKLRAHLDAAAGGAGPAYLIVHIREMRAHVPRRLVRQVRQVRQARRRNKRSGPGDPATWAQEAALHRLLAGLGVGEVDPRTGWAPGYYSHFDRHTSARGWVVVAPGLALVAGADAAEVRALATLIQPRDADTSGAQSGGLLAERYEGVLGRVAQWNGTQDVFEAVSQLEALVVAGEKSTSGQLWLNFALAAIGVLLAVFAGPRLGYGQIAPLLLLALASVLHAIYASTGWKIFQWTAWAVWIVTAVVTVVVLAPLLGAAR
jgi:hypothetical protein